VVRACRARGLTVTPISGPSAVTVALAASGLPTDGFLFLGFLPPKTAARKRTFERWRELEYTLVFYESTHRITKFVDDVIGEISRTKPVRSHFTFTQGMQASAGIGALVGAQGTTFRRIQLIGE